MSSGFWQTKRQIEQFKSGRTTIARVEVYCQTWEARCYQQGIPDEIPDGLMKSGRVPSWKAIAIAILKNDLHLRALGFSFDESALVKDLRLAKKIEGEKQKQGYQSSMALVNHVL